jgi:hypothetical protein
MYELRFYFLMGQSHQSVNLNYLFRQLRSENMEFWFFFTILGI